jgi:hypothetical protein
MKAVYRALAGIALAFVLPGCTSLTLENASYEWPDERVLSVDQSNHVQERERHVGFDVGNLAKAEFGDTTALRGKQLHIIRNTEGYYFLTGQNFKNVYVFTAAERQLTLKSKILVSEGGFQSPEFNRRSPYVQVIDGPSFSRLLTSKAMVEEVQR